MQLNICGYSLSLLQCSYPVVSIADDTFSIEAVSFLISIACRGLSTKALVEAIKICSNYIPRSLLCYRVLFVPKLRVKIFAIFCQIYADNHHLFTKSMSIY